MMQYKEMFEEGYKFFVEEVGYDAYELEDWEEVEDALSADEEDYLSVEVEVKEAEKEVVVRISDDE